MTPDELVMVRERLESFAAQVFVPLTRSDQRVKGELYLRGLLLEGRRKSMQPMAARLGVDHQRLQQFVTTSTWDAMAVRARLARRAVDLIDPVAWVVDDTGFGKDGTSSPCVARQYSGTLGKVGNCQIGVSVHAVTDTASCPLGWRLFVPTSWDEQLADDADVRARVLARRRRCGIPDDERNRPKWILAVEMLDALAAQGLRPPLVAADAGYGDNSQFRAALDERDIGYIMQVKGDALAHTPDVKPIQRTWAGRGRPPTRTEPRYPATAVSLARHVHDAGRHTAIPVTWREGSKGLMRSQFVFLRVRPAGHRIPRDPDGTLPERWLIAQWPDDEPKPVKYWLSSLPADTPPRRPHPARQDPLAHRTRLPRTQNRPGPGPLRRPLLGRLASPHHPRHRGPPVCHHPAPGPKSSRAGLTLYTILGELQLLLATWTGACPTCHQAMKPLHHNKHGPT